MNRFRFRFASWALQITLGFSPCRHLRIPRLSYLTLFPIVTTAGQLLNKHTTAIILLSCCLLECWRCSHRDWLIIITRGQHQLNVWDGLLLDLIIDANALQLNVVLDLVDAGGRWYCTVLRQTGRGLLLNWVIWSHQLLGTLAADTLQGCFGVLASCYRCAGFG